MSKKNVSVRHSHSAPLPLVSPLSSGDHSRRSSSPSTALEIPCQWETYAGTLTAGGQGMMFSGSFFFFETIVSMRWTDIRRLRYDEGLVVTMRKKEEHVFSNVPKSVLPRLIHMQNEALSSRQACATSDESITSITSRTTLDEDDSTNCRTLSTSVTSLADRLPDSVIEKHTGFPVSLRNIAVSHGDTRGHLSAGPDALVFTGRRYLWDHTILVLPWDSVRQIQHEEDDRCIRVVSHEAHDYRWTVVSDDRAHVKEIWETLVACHNVQLTKTPAKPNKNLAAAGEGINGKQLFSSISKSALEHAVVSNVELSCTLQEFEASFLRDNAKHSLARFMESRGDTELETSDWDETSSTRIIRYIHPVNVPMAPPQARARKEQRLVRPNDDTIIVETKTIVDDVPMTDCFYVLDRLHIERYEERVQIRMEFEITFVKSTMFQGIIWKTTANEFTSMFQSLSEFYRNAGNSNSNVPATVTIPTPSPPPDTRFVVEPQYILWGISIALQIWILVELRAIKASKAK